MEYSQQNTVNRYLLIFEGYLSSPLVKLYVLIGSGIPQFLIGYFFSIVKISAQSIGRFYEPYCFSEIKCCIDNILFLSLHI